MRREDVVQARRVWVRATERAAELEVEVAASEQRLEQAHHHWEHWEGRSDVMTAMEDLDRARVEEGEARREFERARREYEGQARGTTPPK